MWLLKTPIAIYVYHSVCLGHVFFLPLGRLCHFFLRSSKFGDQPASKTCIPGWRFRKRNKATSAQANHRIHSETIRPPNPAVEPITKSNTPLKSYTCSNPNNDSSYQTTASFSKQSIYIHLIPPTDHPPNKNTKPQRQKRQRRRQQQQQQQQQQQCFYQQQQQATTPTTTTTATTTTTTATATTATAITTITTTTTKPPPLPTLLRLIRGASCFTRSRARTSGSASPNSSDRPPRREPVAEFCNGLFIFSAHRC